MFLPMPAEYEVIKLHVDKINAKKNETKKKEFDDNGDEIKPMLLKLNKAEEYIFEMGSVQNAEIKLSALSSCLTAKETKETIEKNAESLIKAVNEVRGCSRLRYLLKSILHLGNMINKKNNNPIIIGFKLSSLKKLVEIKTNSGDTLEKYIVSKIYTSMPEALEIVGDMPSLDDAKNVTFSRMYSELKKLEAGIVLMKNIQILEEYDKNSKCYSNVIKNLEETNKLFLFSSIRLNEAKSEFNELCTYLGIFLYLIFLTLLFKISN